MAEPALIVGDRHDEHVQAVLAAMRDGPAPVVLNASSLEDASFRLDYSTLDIRIGGEARQLALCGAHGWVRRLSAPQWRPGTVASSRDAAVRGAWIALVVALASHPEVAWLTPYPHLIAAENKLRQATHAHRLGIRTPRTVVASHPDGIPGELGEVLVVKPLGAAHFLRTDGEARVVWAQALRRDDPRLAALGGAPFLVQEQIGARRHLRVVTLKNRVWSCSLHAAGLPLDWRRDDDAHHAFVHSSEPAVEEAALRLASDLGLGYSSQDWIDTDGGAVFVDLNPAGQWLFLPEPVSSAVAHALADHLSGA